MNITLHIERLILEGLPMTPSQGSLVQAAVETELARLLTAEGLAPGLLAGGALPYLPTAAIQLATDSNPTHLGTQIAQAVYGGMAR